MANRVLICQAYRRLKYWFEMPKPIALARAKAASLTSFIKVARISHTAIMVELLSRSVEDGHGQKRRTYRPPTNEAMVDMTCISNAALEAAYRHRRHGQHHAAKPCRGVRYATHGVYIGIKDFRRQCFYVVGASWCCATIVVSVSRAKFLPPAEPAQ